MAIDDNPVSMCATASAQLQPETQPKCIDHDLLFAEEAHGQGQVLERSKSKLEELRDGNIPVEEYNPNSIVAMGITRSSPSNVSFHITKYCHATKPPLPLPSIHVHAFFVAQIWPAEIMNFLRQCIDTKRPTIVGISLEVLHRLVMYKLIHGQVCQLAVMFL